MQTASHRFSGRKLVEMRNRAGITQAEVARRAGVHQSQLSRWENGQIPGADIVGLLAGALGCEIGDLFVEGDGTRESDEDDEESELLAAAHVLELHGDYAMANRLRLRAKSRARARSRT